MVRGLTCVRRVGRPVEEAGGGGHAQVAHGAAVAVHGGGDGVVVGLLRRGAGGVASGRNAVGVAGVAYSRAQPARQSTTTTTNRFRQRPRPLAAVSWQGSEARLGNAAAIFVILLFLIHSA